MNKYIRALFFKLIYNLEAFNVEKPLLLFLLIDLSLGIIIFKSYVFFLQPLPLPEVVKPKKVVRTSKRDTPRSPPAIIHA